MMHARDWLLALLCLGAVVVKLLHVWQGVAQMFHGLMRTVGNNQVVACVVLC